MTVAVDLRGQVELKQRWQLLAQKNPHLFPSEIAERLGVSEAELMASRIGEQVTLLEPDWDGLLGRLHTLGPVKTVTRNRSAVIEREGSYPRYEAKGGNAVLLRDSIALRLSLRRCGFAFAMEKPAARSGDAPSRSIQIFDRFGDAVHKAFLLPSSSLTDYQALVKAFFTCPTERPVAVASPVQRSVQQELSGNQRVAFLDEWLRLEDAHDFLKFLQRFSLNRVSGLKAAEGRFTRRVSKSAASVLLRHLAKSALPFRLFAGNRGCVQIHKGRLDGVDARADWISARGPGTKFHLRPANIAASWVVKKPTRDGTIDSLEMFDSQGNDIAMFFGARDDTKAQSREWRALVGGLS